MPAWWHPTFIQIFIAPESLPAEPRELVEDFFDVLMALVFPYTVTGRPEERQMAVNMLAGGTMATLLKSEGGCERGRGLNRAGLGWTGWGSTGWCGTVQGRASGWQQQMALCKRCCAFCVVPPTPRLLPLLRGRPQSSAAPHHNRYNPPHKARALVACNLQRRR